MSSSPQPSLWLVTKRMLDAFIAACALLFFSPVLLVTAYAVWSQLGTPVLFKQLRAGKDEKLFTLYKFRSMRMISNAEGEPLPDADRLPEFGQWLRAMSLDELPELWNVLKGDMSIVGPRPLLPDYLPYYSDRQKLRHLMRPGLTGLAQIKGRNAVGWDERLALDSWYVTHWSLWLDMRIILATFKLVMSRHGISAPGEATMGRFDDHVREQRSATHVPANMRQ